MNTPASQHSIRWPSTDAKSYWTQISETFPGLTWFVPLCLLALLFFDFIQWQNIQSLSKEAAQLKSALHQTDSLRETAVALTERNLQARAGELARRQSLKVRELHLALDSSRATLYLRRDGFNLREMPVTLAPPVTEAAAYGPGTEAAGAAAGPGAEAVTAAASAPVGEGAAAAATDFAGMPKGKRTALRLWEGEYHWAVPETVYRERGEPVPAQRVVSAPLGPIALELSDGTLLYTRPVSGPLSDREYQLPGSILIAPADLEAVRASLSTGLTVYLY